MDARSVVDCCCCSGGCMWLLYGVAGDAGGVGIEVEDVVTVSVVDRP